MNTRDVWLHVWKYNIWYNFLYLGYFYWAFYLVSTGVIASEKHGAEMNTVTYLRFDFYRDSSQESYTQQKHVYTKAWSTCHNALCFTRIPFVFASHKTYYHFQRTRLFGFGCEMQFRGFNEATLYLSSLSHILVHNWATISQCIDNIYRATELLKILRTGLNVK